MSNTVLVGAQWGDEGKGKVIDVLTAESDIVIRFQGGNNAGHTVKTGNEKYVLHLIPSGILHDDKISVIGNGVVVDPVGLVEEINGLERDNIKVGSKLKISDRAPIVFPFHKVLDAKAESGRSAAQKIGTTQRGIGPAYADKVSREGMRIGDFLRADFREKLEAKIDVVNGQLAFFGRETVNKEELVEQFLKLGEIIKPYICDTQVYLNQAIKDGKDLLFEGAQGTMLDIDFGTYPYVTSSNTTAGGAPTGSGVAPNKIDRVIGVIKAYTTRVGEGPFPTELFDEDGATLARIGHEFGATTGRPRRCGWFDAVVGRYAAAVNGVDYWAMTKLDVMDTFKTIQVCVAYDYNGTRLENMPSDVDVLSACTPIYEEVPGWESPTTEITTFEELPQKAKDYVNYLCEITGVELGILSIGPKRESTVRVGI